MNNHDESQIFSPSGKEQSEKVNILASRSFEVGKKIEMQHPDQPFDQSKFELEPSSDFIPEEFVRRSNNVNDSTDKRENGIYSRIKVKESTNIFRGTIKTLQVFLGKLKQYTKYDNKTHKILNNKLFSPLNFGKPAPKYFQRSLTVQLWRMITFIIYCLNLILAPIFFMISESQLNHSIYSITVTITIINILLTFHKLVICAECDSLSSKLSLVFECLNRHRLDIFMLLSFNLLLIFEVNLISIFCLFILQYNSFAKAIASFNNRILYKLNDITILVLKIITTCHIFTCIQVRYEIDQQQFLTTFDYFSDYWENLNEILLVTAKEYVQMELECQIFQLFTSSIQLYYKVLMLKLFIVSSLDQLQSYQQLKKMKNIQQYIYESKISYSLKERISKTILQIFERDNRKKDCFEDLENCLKKEQILEEFKQETLTFFVNQYEILSQFSRSTRQQIVSNLSPVTLNPNDTLIFGQEREEIYLYLIKSGKISIQLNEKQHSISDYHASQSLGEFSFFTGQSKTFFAKSLDYTILYKISRDQFLRIISSNPTDIEIAAFIRDQVLFNQNFSVIKKYCYYCNSSQHLVSSCPLINFSKERMSFFDRHLYPHKQSRKFVTRRISIRKNTFLFLNKKNQISVSSSSLPSSSHKSFTESLLMSSVFNQNLEQQYSNHKRIGNGNFFKEALTVIPEDMSQSELLQSQQLQLQNSKLLQLMAQNSNSQEGEKPNVIKLNDPYENPLFRSPILQKLQKKKKTILLQEQQKNNNLPFSISQVPCSPEVQSQQFTQPSQSELLIFASLPSNESLYTIDLDRGQDFEIYYPEYNINPVLFRYKKKKEVCQIRSKSTINFTLGVLISKIVNKTQKIHT